MKFDPVSFFNLSKDLFNGELMYASSSAEINHAFLRTLVSRIYYSILLQAASKHNIDVKGISDSHNAIIEKLSLSFRNNLHDMKDLRIKADYDLNKIVNLIDLEDQFELYDETISNI